MDSEQYREDFLWVAYFGITQTEATRDPELCIAKCIDRAYLDLNRTIHYRISVTKLSEMKKKSSDSKDKEDARAFEEQKKEFRDDVRTYLKGQIDQLLPMQSISKDWFDEKWHKATCEHIMKLANGCNSLELLDEPFSFGQAQKWVNMTLKYMLIMGLWPQMKDIVNYLHVPIDNYILRAALDELGMSGRVKRGGDQFYIFADGNKYPWSGIPEYRIYIDFQKALREAVGSGRLPIEWEGAAWIA